MSRFLTNGNAIILRYYYYYQSSADVVTAADFPMCWLDFASLLLPCKFVAVLPSSKFDPGLIRGYACLGEAHSR